MLLSGHYQQYVMHCKHSIICSAILVVTGCSCSKILCERNIQDEILYVGKLVAKVRKSPHYIEEDAKRLFI